MHAAGQGDAGVHVAGTLQAFKPGRRLRARVIGQRLMDGLAVCSLKSAVVEAGLVSYADFAPGSIASGTVESVEDFGMFVKLAPGVKCALRAASFDVFAFFCLCPPTSVPPILILHPAVDGEMESSRKGRC